MNDLSQVSDFLEEIRIPIRLTVTTPSGWPMVLSLWFQYQDGVLVCATQEFARIISYIKTTRVLLLRLHQTLLLIVVLEGRQLPGSTNRPGKMYWNSYYSGTSAI